jgi:Na+-driven multidrug efflux pump
LRAQRAGMGSTARSGGWLFLRTVSLRVALLATVGVATGIGTDELAGWQIVFTIFSAAAFALDALAIAAQALIGKELGAGDQPQVRRVLGRTVAWGAWFGVIVGALIAALSGVLGIVFTGSAEVASLVQPALLVLAVAQPIAGVVFVLDGVLMGANDARYLAIAGGLNLVPFLPALWIIAALGVDGTAGLIWLSLAFFGIYLLARLATLGWRVRSGRWLAANV